MLPAAGHAPSQLDHSAPATAASARRRRHGAHPSVTGTPRLASCTELHRASAKLGPSSIFRLAGVSSQLGARQFQPELFAGSPRAGPTWLASSQSMGLDTLECPVCSKPLRPPIFQCSKGNFICSPCRDKLPEKKRSASRRCYGVERIVDSTFVPCKHGCDAETTYYDIEGHEKECTFGPLFCPVSGCGFAAPTVALLNHLTTLHKLPAQRIRYFLPFDLRVQPGSHVLCGGYGRLFLLNVASLESIGHAVSIVCAQPSIPLDTIGCSVGFSCFKGHYQVSSFNVGSSSLPDGPSTQCFCVVPNASGGQTDVMLRITILLVYNYNEELVEEDNADITYDAEAEDDMTIKWRMVFRELEAKEDYSDDSNEEEEDMGMIDMTECGVKITNEEGDRDDQAGDHSGD